MKDEMEKNLGGDSQIPLDAETDASPQRDGQPSGTEAEGWRCRCGEASREEHECCTEDDGCEEDQQDEFEERIRSECRRTCRRNFWTEMLKTIAKVAGVVLAAFGLSSFDQED